MINFKLNNELNNIAVWGTEPELSLHWFGLTEGDLWLKFGNTTIYEYTDEVLSYWGNKPTNYNDYPIARFIEDFIEIFSQIRETIPEELYELTKDLKRFETNAKKWLDINNKKDDSEPEFYDNKYDKLISWTYRRSFDSAHLIGGPHLSFFRRKDKIRIVWATDHVLENGISLWTAKDGSFEMDYSDFTNKIKVFGQTFFAEMEKQVELAVAKNWGNTQLDKQRLVEEHEERKHDFFANLLFLDQEPTDKTNWTEIEQLFYQMTKEVAGI